MQSQIDNFVATDQAGNSFDLYEALVDGPVVVFFYPKASTSVCTAQSCAFRDLSSEFADLGAKVVGVSFDKAGAQQKFDNNNNLGLPLLTDSGRKIAKLFGVARRFGLPAKRATVVVSQDKTVLDTYLSETNGPSHATWALDIVGKL